MTKRDAGGGAQREGDVMSVTDIRTYEHVKVQLVTIAKFRRPAKPRTCNVHRYHVWIFRNHDPDDWTIPKGMKCQCGCLTE